MDDRVYRCEFLAAQNKQPNFEINTFSTQSLFKQAIDELLHPPDAITFLEHKLLNRATGGFRANEFSILCGSTGSGKTELLASLSADLLKQKIPHFVASVETGPTDFIRRVLASLSGKQLNTGDPIEQSVIDDLVSTHGDLFLDNIMHVSLHENRFSVEELIANIEWARKKRGCQIAFIDNLNFFLDVTSARDSVSEMDRVIHELIIYCKTCDQHVLMVMHPKKTINGRVESEFDVKGSSTAVQESHNVFLFNRLSEEQLSRIRGADHRMRDLKIAKMRRRGQNVGESLLYTYTNGGYHEHRF